MISCLAQFLPKSLRKKTCVVFDAAKPPRGVSDRYVTHEIEIRYAVGYNSADDLLEELIRANQTPQTFDRHLFGPSNSGRSHPPRRKCV